MSKSQKAFQLSSKFIIIFVCFCGFLYQTSNLLTDYMSGKTIVSLEVGRKPTEALPAITLCTKNILGALGIHRTYPEMQNKTRNYFRLASQYQELHSGKIRMSEERKQLFMDKLVSIFEEIKLKINLSSLSPFEILQNLSFNVKYPGNFNIWLIGTVNKQDKFKFVHTYSDKKYFGNLLYEPVESIKIEVNEQSQVELQKCFTFFSGLESFWRNFTFKLSLIEFHLFPRYFIWVPDQLFKEISFSMHSPNTLPRMNKENFILLKTDLIHNFQYSQINTKLLGKGYDTNCYDYDLNYKHANFNMRSDCITSCYRSYVQNMCKISGHPSMQELVRADWLEINQNKLIDQNIKCYQDKIEIITSECSNECRSDCKFSYYLWQLNSRKRNRDEGHTHLINIKPNRLPDIHINYLPQITFISFVCSFGGLLGMWLGLSFYGIITNLAILFKEILTDHGFVRKKLGSFCINGVQIQGYRENYQDQTNIVLKRGKLNRFRNFIEVQELE